MVSTNTPSASNDVVREDDEELEELLEVDLLAWTAEAASDAALALWACLTAWWMVCAWCAVADNSRRSSSVSIMGECLCIADRIRALRLLKNFRPNTSASFVAGGNLSLGLGQVTSGSSPSGVQLPPFQFRAASDFFQKSRARCEDAQDVLRGRSARHYNPAASKLKIG
jgi:hypothetical protein